MEFPPSLRIVFFCARPIAKLLAGGRRCRVPDSNGMEGASYFWQPSSSTSKHSAVFLAPLANSYLRAWRNMNKKLTKKLCQPEKLYFMYTLNASALSLSVHVAGIIFEGA